MNLQQKYQQRVSLYTSSVKVLKRKNTGFVAGELLSFGALITAAVCALVVEQSTGLWYAGALLSLIVYFLIRHFDDKNKEQITHLSALLLVYEKELKALEGDFSPFETGEKYIDPKHPFTFDLDIFGSDSLYNRVCRTISSGGSDALASSFSRTSPLDKDEILQRVALQKELAEQDLEWRMEFLALGERNGQIDTRAVGRSIENVSSLSMPGWYGSAVSLVMAWVLIVGVCSSVVLAALDVIPASIPLWWVMVQYVVVFFCCKQTLDQIDSHGGKLRSHLVAYSHILQLIARRRFHSVLGNQMQSQLADALPSFTQLERILKGYDRRGNFLGLFFTDAFMLSDFFLVRSFLKWKSTYMVKMEEWMGIVSELDAAVSMADFRYNHPEATDAEIVDGSPVLFEAKNLHHPFLGAKAVKNDFTIHDDNYYIITGANMAGKSTFLRSLGVNYILAMSGMPVFASSLKVSRFQLFSSMRTTDDLTHGISYFNAELLRLEQLMQFCKRGELRTLIILDEILKGTNSLDKLNGSRLFLESISRMPVTGVIATHDLELSRMAESSPGRFHNYCFEIDLGTDVTYTYKIQPGVARNQNATFLLNKILERN